MNAEITLLRPNLWQQEWQTVTRIDSSPTVSYLSPAPAFVWHCKDVTVYQDNVVRDSDGQLRWHGLVSRNYENFGEAPRGPTLAFIHTPCAYIGGHDNFGHTIFEVLTRLAVLHLAGHGDLPVAVWAGTRAIEFLKLIGHPYLEVIAPCGFRDVIVPSCSLGRTQDGLAFAWSEAIWWMRHKFISRGNAVDRLLYCRRVGAKHRNVVNDDEVTAALQALGFENVDLATLPLSEQITLVGSASVLVMAGGASSPMSAFARGAVIELLPPGHSGIFGALIFCAAFGLPYKRINGTPTDSSENPNYTVPVGELVSVVRKCL